MTCACFDCSIRMSASTAHKQSECFTLDCSCDFLCVPSLPAIDDGYIKLLFTGSHHRFSEENHLGLPLLTDQDGPEANKDTHQCKRDYLFIGYSHFVRHDSWSNSHLCLLAFCLGTFSYRINSRLFPVPLHSQECCPVCKKQKSSHPHTAAEPALIR